MGVFLRKGVLIMWSEHVISRFLRTIEADDVVVAFHQLHPSPIYIHNESWSQIIHGTLAVPQELKAEFVRTKILIESIETDVKELVMYREGVRNFMNRPSILYLMLAQGCNNACTYCPIPKLAERYGDNLLSFDDAIAGIKLWQEHLKDEIDDEPYCLILYGGEPLLNRAVLEKVLEYVAVERMGGRLPSKLELLLITNGLLVDDSLATLLAEHNVLTVLGIDGIPVSNNETRRTSEGMPTSAAIEFACRLLLKSGVRLAASMTLTPKNVFAVSEHKAYFFSLGIRSIGFNILKGTALNACLGTMSSTEYYCAAARAVISEYQLNGEKLQEYQLQKRLEAIESSQPFAVDCTCYGSQIVVQADGVVSNCPFLRVDLGHVRSLPDSFRIAQTETVRAWRQRIQL